MNATEQAALSSDEGVGDLKKTLRDHILQEVQSVVGKTPFLQLRQSWDRRCMTV